MTSWWIRFQDIDKHLQNSTLRRTQWILFHQTAFPSKGKDPSVSRDRFHQIADWWYLLNICTCMRSQDLGVLEWTVRNFRVSINRDHFFSFCLSTASTPSSHTLHHFNSILPFSSIMFVLHTQLALIHNPFDITSLDRVNLQFALRLTLMIG